MTVKTDCKSLREQADALEADAWKRQSLLEGKGLDIDTASAAGCDLARRLALVLRSTATSLEDASR